MVRFSDVTKVFPNGYIGLDSVSFSLDSGELAYLTGESGAGKTTLLKLLIREVEPTSGQIWLGDQDVTELPRKQLYALRRKVGMVFQDYRLIPERTVGENIRLGLEIAGRKKDEARRSVEDSLELVGLADKRDLFPAQLSGGELQRTAIARAIALSPTVLFADEPTGNLDFETGKTIMELFHRVAELGTTVLVATHDLDLVRAFEGRQLRLQKGKIVEDTPHQKKTSSKKSGKKAE